MNSFGTIYFARPLFLWGVLFSILLLLFLLRGLKRHQDKVNAFLSPERQKLVFRGIQWGKIRRSIWRIFGCAIFCFLALARPQWGEREEERRTTGLDIFVAVDVSNSMEAEDVVPSRLKRVKYILNLLADRAVGDRLGLVAFAGSAHVLSPLTTDTGYFKESVDSLGPEIVANQGTDLGAALETSIKALSRGAEESGSHENESQGSRVILLVTDGEDHEDSLKAALDQIKKTGTMLFVFGVGTEKGAPIPVRDPGGMIVGYKKDRKGEVVMTHFTGDKLKEITAKANGKFWAIGNGEHEVEAFLKEMGSLSQGEHKEKRVRIREERFQIPLAIAVLFLIFDFLPIRASAPILKSASIVFFIFFPLLGFSVESPGLSVYLKNKRALQALEKKNVGRAKEILSEAQLENPNLPELQYNQGELHAAESEGKKAGEVFQSAGDQAREQNRPELSGPSYFNAGVAEGQKKELRFEAVQSYLRAIEEGKKSKDEELIRRARKNLHFLQDPKNQGGGGDSNDPKQDPKDDKKDNSQESKSGKNQADQSKNEKNDKKDKDDKKEKGDKEKQKEPPSEYDENQQKKNFKSESLSQDAAEQVMNELSQKEKELQGKIQRQKGRPQSLEKDW